VLIYLFTAILYARNTPTRLGNAVDTMLVFGTPLAGFGLQAGLVRGMELGTAFSALGFAALYLLTAMVLARRALASYRLLIECFIAVGVGFATLAVPLALDAKWTSAVWALEGAGAFWVGMRQARWMPRAFGLLLQGVAAMAFLGGLDDAGRPGQPCVGHSFRQPGLHRRDADRAAGAATGVVAAPALAAQRVFLGQGLCRRGVAAQRSRLPLRLFLLVPGLAARNRRRVPALEADAMPQHVFSDRTPAC
jgi:hypothetical protein